MGRVVGIRREERLCFWFIVFERRVEFWDTKVLGGSYIYGRLRERVKGVYVFEKIMGWEVR